MIVAFVGQKGGVGKSTCCIALGAALHDRGATVLMVDGDPQGTLKMWRNVALSRDLPCPEVVDLNDQLPRLAVAYEHVFIDAPGNLDGVTRDALLLSHRAILPCGPTPSEIWTLDTSAKMAKLVQQGNHALQAAILITRKKPRTSLGNQARDALADVGLPVLTTELCDRVAYQEFLGSGLPLGKYAPRDAAAEEVKHLVREIFGHEYD